jgi:hypothetical protein
MKAPTYVWVCHKCRESNQPNTSKCAKCGFPAIASEVEINPESDEDIRKKQERIQDSILLFPEGYIAGFMAFITPALIIKHLIDAKYLAAVLLSVILFVCGYGVILSYYQKEKIHRLHNSCKFYSLLLGC